MHLHPSSSYTGLTIIVDGERNRAGCECYLSNQVTLDSKWSDWFDGFEISPQGDETVLLNRPGNPFLGSGEAAQGPTPAAIANAIFDAVGIRLREIPFTPIRVQAALNEIDLSD
jgi:hypothetical protein